MTQKSIHYSEALNLLADEAEEMYSAYSEDIKDKTIIEKCTSWCTIVSLFEVEDSKLIADLRVVLKYRELQQ